MKKWLIIASLFVNGVSFMFYLLSLLNIYPPLISGSIFFISLLVTIQLITYKRQYGKNET